MDVRNLNEELSCGPDRVVCTTSMALGKTLHWAGLSIKDFMVTRLYFVEGSGAAGAAESFALDVFQDCADAGGGNLEVVRPVLVPVLGVCLSLEMPSSMALEVLAYKLSGAGSR